GYRIVGYGRSDLRDHSALYVCILSWFGALEQKGDRLTVAFFVACIRVCQSRSLISREAVAASVRRMSISSRCLASSSLASSFSARPAGSERMTLSPFSSVAPVLRLPAIMPPATVLLVSG